MKRIKLYLAIGFLCLITSMSFAQQAPDFTKTDCYGVTHNLYSELAAGNAVILNFCAGWCGPCREADPKLEEVYQDACAGTGNIKVYGMLFETNTHGQTTDCAFGLQYAADYGLTFPMMTDIGNIGSGITGQYAGSFGLNAIPVFYIIIPDTANPANSQVFTLVGNTPTLRQDIEDVLNANGFPISPRVSISSTGVQCGATPFEVLTSSKATGNVWSTGDTTQSITVYSSGAYTVQNISNCYGGSESATVSVQLHPAPVAGTMTVTDSITCVGDVVFFDYNGGSSTFAWYEYSVDGGANWEFFAPADMGPIDAFSDEPISVLIRVRAQNGEIPDASCIANSNAITLVFEDVTGTPTVSNYNPCPGEPFMLDYTGGQAGAVWQYFDGISWIDFAPADGGPITESIVEAGQTAQLRVKEYNATSNCYTYSSPLAISTPYGNAFINTLGCVTLGGSVDLDLIGDFTSVVWSTGETTSSVTVTPTNGGVTTYQAQYTDLGGCTFTVEIEVYALTGVAGTATMSQTTACEGDILFHDYSGTDFGTWEYLFPGDVVWQDLQPTEFGPFTIDAFAIYDGLKLRVRHDFDCYGPVTPYYSNELVYSVSAQAGDAGPISGAVKVCKNQGSVTYTVAPIPYATSYTWTLPANMTPTSGGLTTSTNSITVDADNYFTGGTITVKGDNASCGDGAPSALAVTKLTNKPSDPADINGYNKDAYGFCDGGVYTLWTSSTDADSYDWKCKKCTILSGQGSNTVTVLIASSGSHAEIEVEAINCYGKSKKTKLDLNDIPEKADLKGSKDACNNINTVETYTAEKAEGATSFTWWSASASVLFSDGGAASNPLTTSSASVTVDFAGVAKGKHKLEVTANNSCGSSKSDKKDVDVKNCSTGSNKTEDIIEFSNTTNTLAVFPNPVSENLNIALYSELARDYTVKVINITGQVVLNSTVKAEVGENELGLNVSVLAPGMYLVVVQSGDVRMQTRIVKE